MSLDNLDVNQLERLSLIQQPLPNQIFDNPYLLLVYLAAFAAGKVTDQHVHKQIKCNPSNCNSIVVPGTSTE